MTGLGARIRQERLARGLSQGDVEIRTGLLRCYLSRVENGHTEPSLQTLARLAAALDMAVVGFFEPEAEEAAPGPLDAEASAFVTQMRTCAAGLSSDGRQKLLEMARKMAQAPSVR
ncbi:MAG: helix-turn-helix domain-containing protein [Terriglobales bacterium]